jgi:transcriptional regulator with XRE-family HTH domain
MSDAHKLFGGKVREHRLRQGLTQEALAEKCGLHWTYIGGLERGEKNPTLGTISRLADGLGVGVRDFFDRRGRPRVGENIRIYAELTRLLGKEDPQTKAMAIDVLRDVISWKQRYGIKK